MNEYEMEFNVPAFRHKPLGGAEHLSRNFDSTGFGAEHNIVWRQQGESHLPDCS